MKRSALGKNVLDATKERVRWLFATFDKNCISFSGEKESTVLLHLMAETARVQHRKFSVLFIDKEVCFSQTIEHISAMKELYMDVIDTFYWIALPMTLTNSTSQYQPLWVCWETDVEWLRSPPEYSVTDKSLFPFYYYGMAVNEFIAGFSQWFSQNAPSVISIGTRAENSASHIRAFFSENKMSFHKDKPWTTASKEGFCYYAYPLYDWKVKDIWLYYSREKKEFNPVYELMYKAGVSPHSMNISPPYSIEQRKNLWLYSTLDPDTGKKVIERVKGAYSGALYGHRSPTFYGQKDLKKPENLTWESYVSLLLNTLPIPVAEHYRNKIFLYLNLHKSKMLKNNIPEEQYDDVGKKIIRPGAEFANVF